MSGRPKLKDEQALDTEAEQMLHIYETRNPTIHRLGIIFGMTYSSANRRLVRARRNRKRQG